jgi:hypothetical protein
VYKLIHRAIASLAVALVVIAPSSPRAAQSVPALDKAITYILPQWGLTGATQADVNAQRDQLISRIGPEGRLVKLGFTTYINVVMAPVDPANTQAVRDALAPTLAQMDAAIAKASAANIPICLSFITALRSSVDPLQESAQQEDRRNMQWHSDQSLAAGWATLSRYARKQERIREAFIRELGRQLASRMLAHPDIVVAASGDGEVELSYEMSAEFNPARQGLPPLLADYSPFAVAEFRDWLRGTGMYAAGQPFAGEAYRNSARYAGESAWTTLNADVGTTVTTWALKYEDWSLSDSETARTIPASTYNNPAWGPAVSNANGFDPPRTEPRGHPWRDLWDEFRQAMVYRHNLSFAKWITTSADIATGATVPAERWFSDQIPADYLFGFTPQNPNPRLETSASPYSTADVRPFGSLGITSFSAFVNGQMHRTLPGVAPMITQRDVRWGIFEWNPSVPTNDDIGVYRQEMALVEQYRPSLLVPFYWNSPDYPILGTPFEPALKELVARLNVPPLTLSRTSLVTAANSSGLYRTPPQLVRVSGVSGDTPAWSITFASEFLEAATTADGLGFTVAPKPNQGNAVGQHTGSVVITPADSAAYSPATLTVTLNVSPAGGTAPPFGSFDTPTEGTAVSGEVGVTGWALDDIGVVAVDIYRSPTEEEPQNFLIFLGTSTFVPGARPDVQTAFGTRPLAEQAGWGYMLLTNVLPNQGNGAFTLHAIARDVEGYTVSLGSRRIVGQNTGSLLPFGTIDTPRQGETVSGTILNWAWALSVNGIEEDGSTLAVYIDGNFVGRPVYGGYRSDVATLFPGYPNSNGAVGYFVLDTTLYANGIHTVAWGVIDKAGQARGIGSRYFTIANP